MTDPFKIGIAGLGTVGVGVIKNIQNHKELLKARCGREIQIVAVNARDKAKDRGVDLSAYQWVDQPADLAEIDGLDCVVELIGGSDGAALDLVKAALSKGIHVVTANKALMAHHGLELAELAEKNDASLQYEAAVAGGIPIIKSLKEGFAANRIEAVYGILNGTCNYILTEMRETGRDFDDVLAEAQAKGYAEADPTFDVDGIDAAHKLCLLTALAFGTKPDFDAMEITGIRHINTTDITFASELGYRIKLLGIARRYEDGILQTMEPCLVPRNSTLGTVEGVFNAVHVEGDFVQTAHQVGHGAGEGPTASSVMSDVIDLARGFTTPVFGLPASGLQKPDWADSGAVMKNYYMRLTVYDKPGVLADVSAILRDHRISIETLTQRGHDPDQPVALVMTTHEARHKDMQGACKAIEALPVTIDKPCIMAIEDIE